jgi:hypothetical protein
MVAIIFFKIEYLLATTGTTCISVVFWSCSFVFEFIWDGDDIVASSFSGWHFMRYEKLGHAVPSAEAQKYRQQSLCHHKILYAKVSGEISVTFSTILCPLKPL